ncbi:protein kinase, putative [Bodo saltans]|uniref:Protein kinase, putative n=1 Tax=Bodo saltans TaxID=75058 RepID=A0A0S4KK57_BODSA|nr:protein kinase, putative [Bodo saltans]|eukprot:CUI13117.1 protein kinase, putative [Bodo saltans]
MTECLHIVVSWTKAPSVTSLSENTLPLDQICLRLSIRLTVGPHPLQTMTPAIIDKEFVGCLNDTPDTKASVAELQRSWFARWSPSGVATAPVFPLMLLGTSSEASAPLSVQLPPVAQNGAHPLHLEVMLCFSNSSKSEDEAIFRSSSLHLTMTTPLGVMGVVSFLPNDTFFTLRDDVKTRRSSGGINFSPKMILDGCELSSTTMMQNICTFPKRECVTMSAEVCCPSGHVAEALYEKPSNYFGIRCDVCRSNVPDPSVGFLHCASCKWDLCASCDSTVERLLGS